MKRIGCKGRRFDLSRGRESQLLRGGKEEGRGGRTLERRRRVFEDVGRGESSERFP